MFSHTYRAGLGLLCFGNYIARGWVICHDSTVAFILLRSVAVLVYGTDIFFDEAASVNTDKVQIKATGQASVPGSQCFSAENTGKEESQQTTAKEDDTKVSGFAEGLRPHNVAPMLVTATDFTHHDLTCGRAET